jgi:hypothetical protein
MPGIYNFKRPEGVARMLAKAISNHVLMLRGVALAQASFEAASKASKRDRELEWHDALRTYRTNETLRWWLVMSERDPRYYKVIRAGDVDDDTESRSWNDFKKKWRIVELVRGYWLLERKEDNPHEGMAPGMIDALKKEEAEIAAERAAKGLVTPVEAKKGEASARSKRYRLMKKAKELHTAFWAEVAAEDKVILRETTMGLSEETRDKAWTAACEAAMKRYGLKNILMDPTERGNLEFYAELFASGELLKKPPKKEPVASKRNDKVKDET